MARFSAKDAHQIASDAIRKFKTECFRETLDEIARAANLGNFSVRLPANIANCAVIEDLKGLGFAITIHDRGDFHDDPFVEISWEMASDSFG